jgi:hypothetical protein
VADLLAREADRGAQEDGGALLQAQGLGIAGQPGQVVNFGRDAAAT